MKLLTMLIPLLAGSAMAKTYPYDQPPDPAIANLDRVARNYTAWNLGLNTLAKAAQKYRWYEFMRTLSWDQFSPLSTLDAKEQRMLDENGEDNRLKKFEAAKLYDAAKDLLKSALSEEFYNAVVPLVDGERLSAEHDLNVCARSPPHVVWYIKYNTQHANKDRQCEGCEGRRAAAAAARD